MSVQMELSRIIISEINDQQVVYLKEVEGDRTFPILIGLFEATSIDRRVKSYRAPRPLTHDLLVNTIEALGANRPLPPAAFHVGCLSGGHCLRGHARPALSSRGWPAPVAVPGLAHP